MFTHRNSQTNSDQLMKICHLLLVSSMALYLVVGAIPPGAASAAEQRGGTAGPLLAEMDTSPSRLSPHQALASQPVQPAVDPESAISTKPSGIQSKPQTPDAVNIDISDGDVVEGDSSTTPMVFVVELSEPALEEITVAYQTEDVTAKSAEDYISTSGTLIFPIGIISRTISVDIIGDTIYEYDETLFMELSNPSSGTLLRDHGDGTILNDDLPPSLSIVELQVLEGDSVLVSAPFTVTLSATSEVTATVQYSTTGLTAQSGVDYIGASGTITFTPGMTETILNVQVIGDLVQELTETFIVVISNPQEASITVAEAIGTILDNDPPPALSIADVQVIEGNNGTTTAAFPVTLSVASELTITVQYSTTAITAQSGVDFIDASGTITFTPGITEGFIDVLVIGDTLDELNKTFIVGLRDGVNATISGAQAAGTILDDDPPVSLSIGDTQVIEGNSGTTSATFTVTLSASSGLTITVQYSTTGVTAQSGVDFIGTSGAITFTPGMTQTSLDVMVVGDTLDEFDETFKVVLSNEVNSTLTRAEAAGTILDDDPQPDLLVTPLVTVSEGTGVPINMVFTVTLSVVSGKTITVTYATQDGSANAGVNYLENHGELVFAPGDLQKTITIQVTDDTICRLSLNFYVNLSNPVNVNLPNNQMQGVILNEDTCDVFLPVVRRDPVFADDFNYADPSQVWTKWEQIAEASATWFVQGDEFHGKHIVTDRNAKAAARVYAPQMPGSYSVEVKVKLASGSVDGARCGVLFDFLDNTRTYRFVIMPGLAAGDNWLVQKRNPTQSRWDTLLGGTGRAPMNSRNEYNLLRVARQGASIKVYLNDMPTPLWSGSDSTFVNGRGGLNIGTPVGLLPGTYVEVIFDDFLIDNLR